MTIPELGTSGLYRKKPVVIEAWRWTLEPGGVDEPDWVRDALGKFPEPGGLNYVPGHPDGGPRIEVATLEGTMVMRPGWWLIRGVQGELYPCKHEIFVATYEFAEPELTEKT